MVWLTFFLSSLIIVIAAIKLAEYADIIAVRTNMGSLIVGTILLAGATSLPELLSSLSAFAVGEPNLAAGNFLGSNMVNMLILAMIDLLTFRVPLLRRIALTHTLTATLSTILMLSVICFMVLDIGWAIGWMGVDSLLLSALYLSGVWLIQREQANTQIGTQPLTIVDETFPSLRRGVGGFLVACATLVVVVPFMVRASAEIAAITGAGTTFIGTALLSVVTSLPELIAAIGAVRLGALDLAVGNLFGSSVFNMLGLGVADLFFTSGNLLASIDSSFILVVILGLLMTNIALFGNLSRVERRIGFIELDALLILLVYVGGMYALFVQG